MFPRFKERLGTAVDLVVEFSTLGEYRLDPAREQGSWRPSATPPAAMDHGPAWEGPARGASLRQGAEALGGGSPARRLDEVTPSRHKREVLERAGGAQRDHVMARLASPAAAAARKRPRRPGVPAVAPQPCLTASADEPQQRLF